MNSYQVKNIDASRLRQLWSVIEETQTSLILKFSDTDLVKQVLRQIDSKELLTSDEANTLSTYLYSKTSLIRDLAYERLS